MYVKQLKQCLFVVIPLASAEIIDFCGKSSVTSESTKLNLSLEAYLIATVSGYCTRHIPMFQPFKLHPCDWIHVNSLQV